MANPVFQRVGPARVGRSVFDLSHQKLLTCDMGELIPVMYIEMVPGDVFSFGHELVIRMQPLVAPVLHEINAYIHTFFVPYRLLWDEWESFITGGADGTEAPTIPTWVSTARTEGGLWDYFGHPLTVDVDGIEPVAFPVRAYNLVYNEYYRDQTLTTELDITTADGVKKRAWEKDYFTSALPWQQRGTAPALPISGIIEIDGQDTDITFHNTSDAANKVMNTLNSAVNFERVGLAGTPTGDGPARWGDPSLEVDLSGATTFDVADLRLAFQIQRWLERNARAGARYTEFLKSHFGVAPRDDRLDRPEFLGGMKAPVVISEVLQTGETGTTPQGNMAGHGITVDRRGVGKYRAQEFGMMLSILSIMPRTSYSQGVDRMWLKSTKYDFYFPEFAHLSEQPVLRGEIYATSVSAENNTLFGYQGRYDEMRVRPNSFHGQMRSTFDYWHFGRQFTSAPALNNDFIFCDPRKDAFASSSDDGFIVSCGNQVRAVRPMPIVAEPGMLDH